ncbi:hypothetical protein [Pseudomonas protegens]|uniref:hypothetical protein n=1 Tax=Pseudomonas protegens TaxID=380021 RepID=UPI00160F9F1D|nr:hypothetical protein [Pseudomonas protegens]
MFDNRTLLLAKGVARPCSAMNETGDPVGRVPQWSAQSRGEGSGGAPERQEGRPRKVEVPAQVLESGSQLP